MPTEVRVPEVKWSMVMWKNHSERPRDDERILMEKGGVVYSGRYLDGRFICAAGEIAQKEIRLWSSWPVAPKW